MSRSFNLEIKESEAALKKQLQTVREGSQKEKLGWNSSSFLAALILEVSPIKMHSDSTLRSIGERDGMRLRLTFT